MGVMTISLLRFQETQCNEGAAPVSPDDPLKGEVGGVVPAWGPASGPGVVVGVQTSHRISSIQTNILHFPKSSYPDE